jgi:signal peptidase I
MGIFMKILKEVIGWGLTILFAVFIALILNLFVFQPRQVFGDSMFPTLHNGDIGIISKVGHTIGLEPQYNDIVVIDSRVEHVHTLLDDLSDSLKYNIIASALFKQKDQTYWIKRVIGKPGDTIEIENNKVYRNGKALVEPYINEDMVYPSGEKVVVPAKYVYVMGDNRNNSKDSRVIGCVPYKNIIGTLKFKF